MRILVFFDLPTELVAQRAAYRTFRRYLLKNGFMMLQESVYCKLVPNAVVGDAVKDTVRRQAPKEGIVQMLVLTEKQFSRMEYVVGANTSDILNSDERLVIL